MLVMWSSRVMHASWLQLLLQYLCDSVTSSIKSSNPTRIIIVPVVRDWQHPWLGRSPMILRPSESQIMIISYSALFYRKKTPCQPSTWTAKGSASVQCKISDENKVIMVKKKKILQKLYIYSVLNIFIRLYGLSNCNRLTYFLGVNGY